MVRPMRFGRDYRLAVHIAQPAALFSWGDLNGRRPGFTLVPLFYIATNSGKHRISATHFVLACLVDLRSTIIARFERKGRFWHRQSTRPGRVGTYMQHPKGLHGVAVLNHTSLRCPFYGRLLDRRREDRRRAVPLARIPTPGGDAQSLYHVRPMFSLSESHASQAYRALCRAWQAGACDGLGWQPRVAKFHQMRRLGSQRI